MLQKKVIILQQIVIDMNQQQQYGQNQHKNEIKTAFTNYSKDMIASHSHLFQHVNKKEFYKLNQQRKAIMMKHAIEQNQKFLDQIVQYMNQVQEEEDYKPNQQTTYNNKSKIKVTLKQFYRQWCQQSKQKDDYIFIKDQCLKYLKKDDCILVPGCGLGRLVFELVNAGFGAQGNEITYFMLFGSNFIINYTDNKQQFQIYPFIHSSSYYHNEEDIYRSIKMPEIAPSVALTNDVNFGISAGQFTAIYNQRPESFQGIATCFFLDTANNIFDYIDTIALTVKKGGIWINFGPLLYHFKQMFGAVSIQVSWQTVKLYIDDNFQFLEECQKKTTYCHDPLSDMSVQYKCIYFVCRKRI